MYTDVKYTSAEQTGLSAKLNGRVIGIPVASGNSDYDEILRQVAEENLVIAPYVEPEKGYEELRREAYPYIGDQLDMIYHAGEGGDEFQAAIQAVKDAHPKPEEEE